MNNQSHREPKALKIAILGLAVAACSLRVSAGASPDRGTPPPDPLEREAWNEELSTQRGHQIAVLLELFRALKDDPAQLLGRSRLWYAVSALGTLRAEEAVAPLTEAIDLRFSEFVHSTEIAHDPVVVQTLASIGRASSAAALESLAKDKSSKRAPRYLRVIYLVEGSEIGKFMLQSAAEKESDPEKKARLLKAVELFAKANEIVQ